MKSKFLVLAILLALSGNSSAQTMLATTAVPPPSPSPTAIPAMIQPGQTQQALPAAPAAPASTAPAVSALQASIQAQQAEQSQQPQSSIDDEATMVRQVAKKQARLSLLLMEAKVAKAEMDVERERLKFEKEKADAQQASNPVAVAAPTSAPGQPPVAPAPVVELPPEYTVKSVYSFNGKSFAEISNGSSKVVATPGSTLPGGAKVVSISPNSVVIAPKSGKRVTLSVQSQ